MTGTTSVCFHIKPFFLPVEIQHTQSVSVLILPPGEIQALWSQNHGTETLHCNAVISVDNAMAEKNERDTETNIILKKSGSL